VVQKYNQSIEVRLNSKERGAKTTSTEDTSFKNDEIPKNVRIIKEGN
jgi:hypothetical protein